MKILAAKPVFSMASFGPILAACLMLGQMTNAAANSCAVRLGRGRVMVEGPFEMTLTSSNLQDEFLRQAAEQRHDVSELLAHKVRFKPLGKLDWQREYLSQIGADFNGHTELHKDEDQKLLYEDGPLKGLYYHFLKEGNSDRGINVGASTKKDLGFKYKITSHADLKWTDPVTHITYPLFARDLPEIAATRPGDSAPSVIFLLNHGKSKRNNPGDPQSVRYATAAYEGIREIVLSLQKRYGKEMPIILMGDFNRQLLRDKEIEPIRGILKSVFESIPGKTFTEDERATHFYFPPGGGKVRPSPMDDIWVTGNVEVLDAKVVQYTDGSGHILPPPRSFAERESRPSDHLPVYAKIRLHFSAPKTPAELETLRHSGN
jgi:hypothetical protein